MSTGQLAGDVAHDFNNMLTAIIGYTDLSLRRVDLENPIRRNLEETKRAAERAASLVRQLAYQTTFIDDAVITIEEPPRETIAPRESKTVLLVEDDEVVLALIRRILVQAGYNV